LRAILIYGGDDKKLELFAKKIFSAIERKGNLKGNYLPN